MTDFDIVAAFFAIIGFASLIAGLVVATNLFITHKVAQRATRRDVAARRQERDARSATHPRTGQVAPAPRLAPLADVLVFPDRDGNEAA